MCLRSVELQGVEALLSPWEGWLPAECGDRHVQNLYWREDGTGDGWDLEDRLDGVLVEAAALLRQRPDRTAAREHWSWARSKYVALLRGRTAAWLWWTLERLRRELHNAGRLLDANKDAISAFVATAEAFAASHEAGICPSPWLYGGPECDALDLSRGVGGKKAIKVFLALPWDLRARLDRAGARFDYRCSVVELEALAAKLEARGGF